MAEKLGIRTIEPIPGIKVVAWAQREAGGSLFSGRAVWGEDPVVTEDSIGIIQEGALPTASSSDEAVALAIHDVKRLLQMGVLKSPYG